MKLDQNLVDAAIKLATERYPDGTLAGAVAMYTKEGDLLTSTYPAGDTVRQRLCYETGAICEAHKLGHTITASVCVVRRTGKQEFIIYAPCGLCQERLFFWGPDVEVAVPDKDNPAKWIAKTLKEIQPYYWAEVLERS
jgi:cytidine deaminase